MKHFQRGPINLFFITFVIAAAGPVSAAGSKPEPANNVGAIESRGGARATPVAENYLADGYPKSAAQGGKVREIEPNDSAAQATILVGSNVVAIGNLFPNGDVDYWSFDALAGDRVYAATQTSFHAGGASAADSQLTLVASDGTTVIEFDDDDGSIGLSSSIAGATIPAAGTYYLKVNHFSATGQARPYDLHFRLQSGGPTAEIEPNDTAGAATPLPSNGWVTGAKGTTSDVDYYSLSLNAGDTVFLSLDLDPERDLAPAAAAPGGWNGRLGIANFGDALNLILTGDDPGNAQFSGPALSESLFMTVKNAGTYYVYVDSASVIGGSTFTYDLSVSVHPASPIGTNCTVYTSPDVPRSIGPSPGTVDSLLSVPGNPRIEDLNVSITLNHALMADIDAALVSPAGNEVSLFTDIGATGVGGQTQMDADFDDEAGLPPLYTVTRGASWQPEASYRLAWFKGENAGGIWALRLRDDLSANGGVLTAWSLTICEPPPAPTCSGTPVTVYASDFEANDGGFVSSGTANEWERGLPSFAPITSCNSGTSCWKTDLDNSYNTSSNQDLVSPTLSLAGLAGPIQVSWAQRYQMAGSSAALADSFLVEVRNPGPANPRTLFQYLDGTMTDAVGNPSTLINESAGWGVQTRDISAYANSSIQLRFNLTSDATTNLAGLAIDDVTVTACCTAASCDDGNPCTADTCTASGCVHTPDPVAEVNDSVRVNKTDPTTAVVSWSDGPGTFNVYRGFRFEGAFAYDHACWAPRTAGPVTDPNPIADGWVTYYLVARESHSCESGLGANSAGTPRPNLHTCDTNGCAGDVQGQGYSDSHSSLLDCIDRHTCPEAVVAAHAEQEARQRAQDDAEFECFLKLDCTETTVCEAGPTETDRPLVFHCITQTTTGGSKCSATYLAYATCACSP